MVEGTGADDPTGLMTLGDKVFISGYFSGTLHCGPNQVLVANAQDAFVMRLSQSLEPELCFHIQGNGDEKIAAMDSTNDGRIAIAGSIQAEGIFGDCPPIAATGVDGFVAILNPMLEVEWAHHISNAGTVEPTALAVDGANRLILGGRFSDTVDFGTGEFASAGGFDGFVVAFPPAAR